MKWSGFPEPGRGHARVQHRLVRIELADGECGGGGARSLELTRVVEPHQRHVVGGDEV